MEQSAQGGSGDLKAYTIGVSALGVNTSHSSPETTARMQASRVRRLLEKYYSMEGRADPVELVLPTGTYEPRYFFRHERPKEQAPLPRLRIQCFENVSKDPLDDQFSSALAESLVDLFIDCRHLKVLDASNPGAHEDFTLNGKITRVGSAIRVSCHLTESVSGESKWSDRYTLELGAANLLEAQDDLASRLACRLGDLAIGAIVRLAAPQEDFSAPPSPLNEFLKCLVTPSVEALHGAEKALESGLFSAVTPPPLKAAPLNAAYSCTLSLLELVAPEAKAERLVRAEDHARLATSQDSTHPLGHLAKALVHYHYREELCVARELSRCLELDRTGATLRATAGLMLVLIGRHKEGLEHLDRAYECAPHLPGYFKLAYAHYYFCEVGDARQALKYGSESDFEFDLPAQLLQAACLSRLGHSAQARARASRVAAADRTLARLPAKRLTALLFQPRDVETLCAALSGAGLGTPSRSRRSRSGEPRVRVSISQGRASSEIRIGILHSLSGTMALSEAHLVNAAMLAVEEINREGGVLGQPVHAVVEDGGSRPELFSKKAQKLVEEDGATSIFGCWTSSSRKAVLPVVERRNALLWYPLQYEGLEKSRHVIYTGSCLNQQIEPAVRWALRQQRKSCYLVGSDYVFPRTANRLIQALVESDGGRVLGHSYHQLGGASFDQVAEEIARLKPEIVYNTVNGSDNVLLLQALARAGVRSEETPVLSFSLSELELSECSEVAQGQLACWSYFQSMTTRGDDDLVSRFQRRYGPSEVLSDPSLTAYSQIHLWKSVVEKAQSLDTDALLDQLTSCSLQLGNESYRFASNHHVERRAVIGKVSGSQFSLVWSSPEPITPQPWLGVDQTDFLSRDLVMGALQALPEMAEVSSHASRARSRAVEPEVP